MAKARKTPHPKREWLVDGQLYGSIENARKAAEEDADKIIGRLKYPSKAKVSIPIYEAVVYLEGSGMSRRWRLPR